MVEFSSRHSGLSVLDLPQEHGPHPRPDCDRRGPDDTDRRLRLLPHRVAGAGQGLWSGPGHGLHSVPPIDHRALRYLRQIAMDQYIQTARRAVLLLLSARALLDLPAPPVLHADTL